MENKSCRELWEEEKTKRQKVATYIKVMNEIATTHAKGGYFVETLHAVYPVVEGKENNAEWLKNHARQDFAWSLYPKLIEALQSLGFRVETEHSQKADNSTKVWLRIEWTTRC